MAIDASTIIGWVVFAVINSGVNVLTVRYINGVVNRLEKDLIKKDRNGK